jgi:hypothetical protein
MPTTRSFGAFTAGVARLSEHGDLALDSDGAPESLSDIYTVILGFGVRATSANVTGLPAVDSRHATVTSLYVSGYRFSCINSYSGIWNVSVDYAKSETTTIEGGEEDPDFVSKVTARSWDVSESTVDLVCDAETGVSITNAAGDPFDSIPQRTISAPKVAFSRKESRSPAILIALNGTINKSAVKVLGIDFPAYTAKLKVSVRDTMAATGAKYDCSYEIEGRNNPVVIDGAVENIGWRDAFLQCGYTFIQDGQFFKFTTKTKSTSGEEEEKEASSPQLLTKEGGDGRGYPPVSKIVTAYKAVEWASLKLPS